VTAADRWSLRCVARTWHATRNYPARTVGRACGSSQNRPVSTTPLWVPLVIAALGLAASIVGSVGGVIITQRRADRREDLQWQRDRETERDVRAREDALRTFEQRRACYVDFEESLRCAAQAIWDAGHGTGPPLEKAWHLSPYQSLHRLKIFATPDAALAASEAYGALWQWGSGRRARDEQAAEQGEKAYDEAHAKYLDAIRRDLGVE